MKCLSCGKEMSNVTLIAPDDLIAYDVCESCGSFWLDKGELDKMADDADVSVEMTAVEGADAAGEAARKCPRCEDAKLAKVAFPGRGDVVLDRCPSCGGFFLDGGELDLVNKEIGEVAPVRGRGYGRFINEKHLPMWLKRIRARRPDEVPATKGLIVGKETSTPCPACDGKLAEATLYGVKVDTCAKCGGMWLDQGELKSLEERAHDYSWREVAWLDDEAAAAAGVTAMLSSRSCPRCQDRKMFSTAFGDSGVIIDFCGHCKGVWLDHDEFQAINAYVRKKIEALDEEDKKKAVEGLKGVLPGQEGELAEEMDAKVALDSLLSIRIFENPTLLGMLRHRL